MRSLCIQLGLVPLRQGRQRLLRLNMPLRAALDGRLPLIVHLLLVQLLLLLLDHRRSRCVGRSRPRSIPLRKSGTGAKRPDDDNRRPDAAGVKISHDGTLKVAVHSRRTVASRPYFKLGMIVGSLK
jgi:hypothetical protein